MRKLSEFRGNPIIFAPDLDEDKEHIYFISDESAKRIRALYPDGKCTTIQALAAMLHGLDNDETKIT